MKTLPSKRAEIVLAALLHDIGKFSQRAGEEIEFKEIDKQQYLPKKNGHYTHYHALYTLKFLEVYEKYLPKPSKKFERSDDNYINFAARHHNPSTPYEWIIAEADRLSAGMDREEADEGGKRLLSTFTQVFLEKSKNEPAYYDLFPLSPTKKIFPQKDFDKPIDYKDLWKEFLKEFRNLPYNQAFHVYFPALVSILEKYAWCIPSATYHTLPDISLFDHSFSTAALASALFLYHQQKNTLNENAIRNRNEKKFLLVSLDLSGIQKFIFDITIDAAKGAAKMLRARSFYLSLLLEITCLKILDAFNLYTVNRIMDAGGRSILLLPNVIDTKERLKEIQREIELFLKQSYFAELSINIAFLEVAPIDLEAQNFSKTLKYLNYEIELAKKKKFSFIDIEDFVYTDFTKNYDQQKGICKACGKHYGEVKVEDGYYCQYCHEFKKLGSWLTNCDFMGFDKKKNTHQVLKVFDWYVHFFDAKNIPANRGEFYLCYALKSFPGFPLRYIANYVPRFREEDNYNDVYTRSKFSSEDLLNEAINGIKNKSIKTFHHIALSSLWPSNGEYKSRPYLGVLKADVDRLGFIFSYGLNHPQRPSPNKLTLARFCFLSRMLDFFFSGYLPKVLEKEFPDTYTVFAGGDDLLLIGPWENMIYLAEQICNDFRAYVGENPDITLSASLTLVKPRYPVNAVAHLANKYLETAKNAGRDRLCIFGEIVEWQAFPDLKNDALFLHKLLNQSGTKIGMGFVHKLLTLAEMKKHFEKGENIKMGRWHAMFKYLLGRNLKHLDGQVTPLQQMFTPGESRALRVPLSWVLFKNRR